MIDLLIFMLVAWGVIGCFYAPKLPKPTSKREAAIQLLIAGPLCWIILTGIGLYYLLTGRKP